MVTGLTNATAYTFKVAAKNAVGTGGQSAPTAAVTVGAPVTPAAPTATPGSASVTLKWVAPATNGSPITGYVVTPFKGGVAQPVRTFTSVATTEVITGLTNGTAYTFKVAAKRAGNGSAVGCFDEHHGGHAIGSDRAGCDGGAPAGDRALDGTDRHERIGNHGLRRDAVHRDGRADAPYVHRNVQ